MGVSTAERPEQQRARRPAQQRARLQARPAAPKRRRRGSRRREHGQERERIEIALVVRRVANAEVDVRHIELGRTARAYGPDDGALVDARTARDADRAKMREAHGEPGRRLDRERLAVRRHRPREAHDAGSRRKHRRARSRADRDAAVLARVIWMRLIEGERLENRPLDGPGPRARSRHEQEEEQQHKPSHRSQSHRSHPPLLS